MTNGKFYVIGDNRYPKYFNSLEDAMKYYNANECAILVKVCRTFEDVRETKGFFESEVIELIGD